MKFSETKPRLHLRTTFQTTIQSNLPLKFSTYATADIAVNKGLTCAAVDWAAVDTVQLGVL